MATLQELRNVRLEKLIKLRKLGINPYPAQTGKSTRHEDVLDNFDAYEGKKVVVAGRILSIRHHGKISFFDLKDASGILQLYLKEENLRNSNHQEGKLNFTDLDLLDIGDFIEAKGTVVKTKSGEISIEVNYIRLLGKTLRPLPDMWDGLKDKETRLRRRYLDTNINKEVFNRFIRRAKFWEAHREFFKQNGFLEMNIPVLENIPGGADANPFITHMEAIDQDFYLRISQELYLKRLIGGGYEKVYEIGPRFRNEGLSDEHLPEHMAMEFYWAYASWQEGMKMVQDLFTYILNYVYNGRRKFHIRGFDIEFKDEWDVIDFEEVMRERFGVDVHSVSLNELKEIYARLGLEVEFQLNVTRGIDNLWKHLRKDIPGPAFLINHPKYLSPLAKAHADEPNKTERFQPIIAGSELGNGWSEINDPLDQLERFREQQALRDAGDAEAQWLDIDYVEMLEYGMPPTFGYGHSERVFWFLEDVSAREGVPFPQLKHQLDETTKEIYGLDKNTAKNLPSTHNYETKNNLFYTINEEIQSDFPGISFAYVVITGVSIKRVDHELENLKKAVVDKLAEVDLKEAVSTGPIAFYRALFKATGTDYHSKKPSPEALLSRVSKGKGLYTVNTAVDAYNLAVLETQIGLGGFDFSKISGPVILRYSLEGETMNLLGDEGTTSLRAGQIVYADDLGPITLDLNYRDIDRTKITENTTSILLFADGAPGITKQQVLDALERGAEYIKSYCGGTIGELIYVDNSNTEKEEVSMSTGTENLLGLPTRQEALELLEKYVGDEYQKLHAKMVAAAMEAYAKELNGNPDLWYITGLLHDLDYHMHPEEHPKKSLEWFQEWNYPEQLIHAVEAHAHDRLGIEPQTPLAAALCAVDEMAGFLYAYSLMRPEGFKEMQPKSVKKKFKDKSFAAKISREDINYGLEKFGKDFADHVQFMTDLYSRMDELFGK